MALTVSTYNESRSPEFFRVTHEGGSADVGLNEEHPLFAEVQKVRSKGAALKILGAVLCSFHRAKLRMEEGPISDSSLFMSQIEHEWATVLKTQLREK